MRKIVSYRFNKLIGLFSESIWRKSMGKTRPWRSLLARKDSYRTRLLWKNGKFLIHLSCCKGFLLFPNTHCTKLFMLIFFKMIQQTLVSVIFGLSVMQVLTVYSVRAIFVYLLLLYKIILVIYFWSFGNLVVKFPLIACRLLGLMPTFSAWLGLVDISMRFGSRQPPFQSALDILVLKMKT